MEGNNNAEKVKVVLIGEYGVGKTSIILQYTTNKFDPDNVSSLVGSFSSKTVEFLNVQKAIKFEIWDTAGQKNIVFCQKSFIRMLYDITNKSSFDAIKEYWNGQINAYKDGNAILAVVANKSDLYIKIQKFQMKKEKDMQKKLEQYFKLLLQKVILVLLLYLKKLGKDILIQTLIFHLKKKYSKKKRVKESKRKKKLEGNYFRKKKKKFVQKVI